MVQMTMLERGRRAWGDEGGLFGLAGVNIDTEEDFNRDSSMRYPSSRWVVHLTTPALFFSSLGLIERSRFNRCERPSCDSSLPFSAGPRWTLVEM